MKRWALLGCALVGGCPAPERPPEDLKAMAPKPLRALAPVMLDSGPSSDAVREALFRAAPAEVFGEEVPPSALRLELRGASSVATEGGVLDLSRAQERAQLLALAKDRAVLLVAPPDVYVAQAAVLLSALDDAGAQVSLMHPSGKVSFPLVLRDEEAFRTWLDEPKPGKVRVVQRADGFELQSNVGKLPGADPNGPTVPRRGGQQDIATLRKGIGLLKQRFKTAPDLCFLPSFGTDLVELAGALTADWAGMGEPIFEELCVVYPRPALRDR